MIVNTQHEREEFERAMDTFWKDDYPNPFERWPDGIYVYREVATAFVAWQIGRSWAREEAA